MIIIDNKNSSDLSYWIKTNDKLFQFKAPPVFGYVPPDVFHYTTAIINNKHHNICYSNLGYGTLERFCEIYEFMNEKEIWDNKKFLKLIDEELAEKNSLLQLYYLIRSIYEEYEIIYGETHGRLPNYKSRKQIYENIKKILSG